MSEEEKKFTILMEKTGKMQFTTTFDKEYPNFIFDEPEHSLGEDKYPSASRMLTASVMNCLSASLTFCLLRSRVDVKGLKTKGSAFYKRNEEGRLRIARIEVELIPEIENEKNLKKLKRCIDIYKNYCVVSKSVEQGIEVDTKIVLPD